jgi:protoporphyrinogen oxidase
VSLVVSSHVKVWETDRIPRAHRSKKMSIGDRNMKSNTAVIIGAGPAGLTAAYELLTRTHIVPIVLEKSSYMGGISRTVNYKGNRIDIGGHRFFSKSKRVTNWWLNQMPLEDGSSAASQQTVDSRNSASANPTMLLRSRKSRIYFLRKFFEYPMTLSAQTLKNLGLARTIKIGCSYLYSSIFPPKQVNNLEEFFISRFGRELYKTFFQAYTEKVWGVACEETREEWGAQRIKGLSVFKTVLHAIKKIFKGAGDAKQEGTETSLIERFMYPKLGPGQLWETVAEKVIAMGGQILTNFNVDAIRVDGDRIVSVAGTDAAGKTHEFEGVQFFSTMPVKELIAALDCKVPPNVAEVSGNLGYRDFLTVGILAKKLVVKDPENPVGLIKDNWIYIQDPDVIAGRLQIFNNWSPFMVKDPDTVWIGVEYFCKESDDFWKRPDEDLAALAKFELEKIGILLQSDVLDSTVVRMEKAYPAYFGSYDRFGEIREYADRFENLFLIGRNGMHRYNNQDHSMLAAMTSVDNILASRTDKSNIWEVNTESEYHEEKTHAETTQPVTQTASVPQPGHS